MKNRQVILELAAALLIMLYLYASLSKFLDFKLFEGDMNNQPFPNSWTPWLIWFIPFSEIAISLALLMEKTRLVGFIASALLLIIFTAYTGAVLLNAFAYVPCSCGGVIRKLSWPQHLAMNLFFLGLSFTGIFLQHNKKKTGSSKPTTKNVFV